jgi:hypothetical protein
MWYKRKVAGMAVTESNKWDLCFSSINVNSLNISTYKDGHCKTLEKLVAITGRGRDIIFMSDCRLGRGIEKLRRILQLGTKTSYNLYSNSTRGDRGVCIAISRSRNVEVIEEVKETVYENYLLLKCKIDQKDILIGAVYGPNTNNVVFYRDLIEKIESLVCQL